MKRILFILSAVILFTSSAYAQDNYDMVNVGDNMPVFSLQSSINGNIDSKDLEGKVVLINIFATWCPPCQVELKEVQEVLYPKYKDNPNFKMLTVGREHNENELKEYNQKKGFSFPLYPDPSREFTSKFATRNIPRSYLIDKNGKIVYTSVGYKQEEFDKLMNLIEKLVNE